MGPIASLNVLDKRRTSYIYLEIFTVTTNSPVSSSVHVATSFDPKLGFIMP